MLQSHKPLKKNKQYSKRINTKLSITKSQHRLSTHVSKPLTQQKSLFKHLFGISETQAIPLNQQFPLSATYLPHGSNDTTPNESKQQLQVNNSQQSTNQTTSTTTTSTNPPTITNSSSLSTKTTSTNINITNNYKLLSSYRQSIFPKGTLISTAQTTTPLPKSTISLSIDFGSRYESPQIQGLTHFLSTTFLRSTTNRLSSILYKDMSKLGIELTSESNRDMFVLTGTTSSERITPIIGTFIDLLLNSSYELPDLIHDIDTYKHNILPNITNNNYIQFQEILHQSAFGNATIGNPLYMKPYTPPITTQQQTPHNTTHLLDQIDGKLLKQWSKQFLTSNRIAINGINVNHSTFMSSIESVIHKVPNTTYKYFPTPQTSYIGKETHVINPSILYKTKYGFNNDDKYITNLIHNNGGSDDYYSGNPMDYVNIQDADNIEQHIGIAYCATSLLNTTTNNNTNDSNIDPYQEYVITHLINSILSTGFIYGNDDNTNEQSSNNNTMFPTPLTSSKSYRHHHNQRFNHTQNQYQQFSLSTPSLIQTDINQSWNMKQLYDNDGRTIYNNYNPILSYKNDYNFAPLLINFDTNYQHYNDIGLFVIHGILPTSSVYARNEYIQFIQLVLDSLSSSTTLTERLVEHHKNKLLTKVLAYYNSTNKIHNISTNLVTHLTQQQFIQRSKLYHENGSNNNIPSTRLKWGHNNNSNNSSNKNKNALNTTTDTTSTSATPPSSSQIITQHHDPIDQFLTTIQTITPKQVQTVLERILQSPPTIVSYTSTKH